MKKTQCLLVTIILLLINSPSWALPTLDKLLQAGPLELREGEAKTLTFQQTHPGTLLLWVQGRLNRPAGEPDSPTGAYALKLALDGKPLTPENVKVLNKTQLILGPVSSATHWPLYDASTQGWLLAYDRDYTAALHQGDVQPLAYRAYFSHFYEYFICIDGITPGTHQLALQARFPDAAKGHYIHVKELELIQPEYDFLLSASTDWMEIVFPWQTPQPDQLFSEPLRVTATAGEYEPLSFSLFALKDIPDLSVELTDFVSTARDKKTPFPAANVSAFAIRSLRRENLGEAQFIAQMPFIPTEWTNYSPELLIPLSEEKPSVSTMTTQRFFLDFHIPAEQPPGLYRGSAKVLSAGKMLADIPMEVEVLPFKLAEARQKYWMWRLTWSPAWQPENVARLRDIKEHGFTGLTRTAGAAFKFKVNESGEIEVDASEYEELVAVLKETGLALRVSDDQVATQLVSAVLKHLKLAAKDVGREAPNLPEEVQQKIRPLVLEGFRQVREISQRLGLTLSVFPVDEPDGTPWRRKWTTYAAGMAKEAGLTTWSTRNNYTWDANIDIGAAGEIMINHHYLDSTIQRGGFRGDLAFPFMPFIGGFRDGAQYHFKGQIDEIYIYNRALTDEEMLQQKDKPATNPVIAYTFEEDQGSQVRDYSGKGNNAEIVGNPIHVSGRQGLALQLNGVDEHVILPTARPYDFSNGWSLSIWYKGSGPLFGKGYNLYNDGVGRIRFTTTEEKQRWFSFGGISDDRFWQHLTVVFDNHSKQVKSYLWDQEMKDWYRKNIEWNYLQIRSLPPQNPRFKTGIMAWYYGNLGNLRNITTFCYDWNFTSLYVVYPKHGERFKNNGVWYQTLGWKGTREGIDDARYLQTLVNVLEEKKGMDEKQAVERVRQLLVPIDAGYEGINKVIQQFGSYRQLRRKVINKIIRLSGYRDG